MKLFLFLSTIAMPHPFDVAFCNAVSGERICAFVGPLTRDQARANVAWHMAVPQKCVVFCDTPGTSIMIDAGSLIPVMLKSFPKAEDREEPNDDQCQNCFDPIDYETAVGPRADVGPQFGPYGHLQTCPCQHGPVCHRCITHAPYRRIGCTLCVSEWTDHRAAARKCDVGSTIATCTCDMCILVEYATTSDDQQHVQFRQRCTLIHAADFTLPW